MKDCIFEPSIDTASATICKWCGEEKFLHTPQVPQQEALFTEKDIMFAYMQGYNRGKDGNPNHMESYIEFIKQNKKD